MNPMLQALQQSREQNPVSSSGPMPGNPSPAPTPGNPGNPDAIAKLSSGLDALSAKLDKVLEALSANYTGKEPDKTEPKENENAYGNGD